MRATLIAAFLIFPSVCYGQTCQQTAFKEAAEQAQQEYLAVENYVEGQIDGVDYWKSQAAYYRPLCENQLCLQEGDDAFDSGEAAEDDGYIEWNNGAGLRNQANQKMTSANYGWSVGEYEEASDLYVEAAALYLSAKGYMEDAVTPFAQADGFFEESSLWYETGMME